MFILLCNCYSLHHTHLKWTKIMVYFKFCQNCSSPKCLLTVGSGFTDKPIKRSFYCWCIKSLHNVRSKVLKIWRGGPGPFNNITNSSNSYIRVPLKADTKNCNKIWKIMCTRCIIIGITSRYIKDLIYYYRSSPYICKIRSL